MRRWTRALSTFSRCEDCILFQAQGIGQETQEAEHNDQGDNSIGNNVLDPSLCTVDKKHTFAWVEISPLDMGHCIGATPEEQAACGVAPPRTDLTTDDVGTLIGFNDWTSGGRNTWAADDGWCAHFACRRIDFLRL